MAFGRPISVLSQAMPQAKMIAVPISIAASVLVQERAQPRSASQPTATAASRKPTR